LIGTSWSDGNLTELSLWTELFINFVLKFPKSCCKLKIFIFESVNLHKTRNATRIWWGYNVYFLEISANFKFVRVLEIRTRWFCVREIWLEFLINRGQISTGSCFIWPSTCPKFRSITEITWNLIFDLEIWEKLSTLWTLVLMDFFSLFMMEFSAILRPNQQKIR
jgi:hypothetical protein